MTPEDALHEHLKEAGVAFISQPEPKRKCMTCKRTDQKLEPVMVFEPKYGFEIKKYRCVDSFSCEAIGNEIEEKEKVA